MRWVAMLMCLCLLCAPALADAPFAVRDVDEVGLITGEDSINQTGTNYGIAGTDLGIPFDDGQRMYIAFGDSFSQPKLGGDWRSNILAVSSDFSPEDGVRFDHMVSRKSSGFASEILQSKKRDGDEITVIPTGGFALDGKLYLCFMSVKRWGEPGDWECNYGGIAMSTDGGQTWIKQDTLRWPGDSLFVQLCPVVVGDEVYFLGISGGRFGPVGLMKVDAASVGTFEKYQYCTALDEDGNPLWVQGEAAIARAAEVVPAPAGELSCMFNPYLGRWLLSYLNDETDRLVMRSADALWGPWSEEVTLITATQYPGLYGAFLHPWWTGEDGRVLYFTMSQWLPIYNVTLMKATLATKN